MVSLGIGFLPYHVNETIELAALADQLGFAGVWLADSQILAKELFSILGACALKTHNLLLGPSVTNPVTRDITIIASAMITIDELSGGRAVLGIGRGDSAVFMAGRTICPVPEFENSVRTLRQLLSNERVIRNKKVIQFHHNRRIPIHIGATGPSMLRLAGRLGDGAIISVGVEESSIRYAIQNVQKGASEAGRDPKEIDLIAWVPCSISDDEEKARRDVSGVVATSLNFATGFSPRLSKRSMAAELQDVGLDIDAVNEMKEIYNYAEHGIPGATHAKHLGKEIIDRFSIAGSSDHCLAKFKQLEKLGITKFIVLPKGDAKQTVKSISQFIMPHLT